MGKHDGSRSVRKSGLRLNATVGERDGDLLQERQQAKCVHNSASHQMLECIRRPHERLQIPLWQKLLQVNHFVWLYFKFKANKTTLGLAILTGDY